MLRGFSLPLLSPMEWNITGNLKLREQAAWNHFRLETKTESKAAEREILSVQMIIQWALHCTIDYSHVANISTSTTDIILAHLKQITDMKTRHSSTTSQQNHQTLMFVRGYIYDKKSWMYKDFDKITMNRFSFSNNVVSIEFCPKVQADFSS